MKNTTKLFALFAVFFLLFSACEGFNHQDKPAYVYISNVEVLHPDVEVLPARTVFPEFTTTNIADYAVTLTGKKTGSSEVKTLAEYDKFSEMPETSSPIKVTIGEWSFTLSATDGKNILTGTITETIQAGDNLLTFALSWDTDNTTLDGTGNLSYTLTFDSSLDDSNVVGATGELVGWDVATTSETTQIDSSDLIITTDSETSKKTMTYSLTGQSAGVYRVKIHLYADSAKTIPIAPPYSELVIITNGQTSSRTRTLTSLNPLYTITPNANGGVIVGESVGPNAEYHYTTYSEDFVLPDLEKSGYAFDGWYTDNTFTTKITSIPKGSFGDKTPYARFIDTLYVQNGGTSTDGTVDIAPLGSLDDAIERIKDFASNSVNWKIVIDGELSGPQSIDNSLTTGVAANLTLQGKTDSDHDILNGGFATATDDGTTLAISTAVPVTIKKLQITGGNTTTNGGGISIGTGANVTIDEDVLITANSATEHGGGIYNEGTLVLLDGTISNNSIDSSDAANAGGAIYSTSDISMEGGVSIPFDDSVKNNDICLASFAKIQLTGSLSETGTIAAIAPDPLLTEADAVNGVTVIESSTLSGSALKTEIAKFAVNKTRNFQSNPTVAIDLMIDDTGLMSKNPWVKVSGKTFTGSETVTYTADDPGFPLANLKNSVVFIEGRTLQIPDLIVCDHEVTQAEYQRFCFFNNKNNPDYRAPGGYNDYGNGDNIPAYFVSWYDALVYCNLLSIAENLDPVYTINGKTDPKQWPNVQTNGTGDETKYRGPSFYKSGDNDNPQKDTIWEAVTCNRNKNGYRLPTQAEWEYIARECNLQSEGQFIYSGTNDITELNYTGQFTAVRTTKPNALGIYDMSGNVSEWCWDLAGAGRAGASASDITTSTPITGPSSVSSGNEEYRVLRGGSTNQVSGNSSNYYHMAITKAEKMRACAFDKQCGIRLIRTDTE